MKYEDTSGNRVNYKHPLFAKYPIRSLAIFGSYARNKQNIERGLDLMVEFNDKIGGRFIDLAEEMESLVKFNVTLVPRNAIKDNYFQAMKSDLIYV